MRLVHTYELTSKDDGREFGTCGRRRPSSLDRAARPAWTGRPDVDPGECHWCHDPLLVNILFKEKARGVLGVLRGTSPLPWL